MKQRSSRLSLLLGYDGVVGRWLWKNKTQAHLTRSVLSSWLIHEVLLNLKDLYIDYHKTFGDRCSYVDVKCLSR